MVRSVPTTFTGKKEQHDAELRDQVEVLRKKIKIRDLKLEPLIADKKPKTVKRSKSVDLKAKKQAKTKNIAKARSLSADSKKLKLDSKSNLSQADGTDKLKYTDVLKQNLERSNSGPDISRQHSPTPSILKTSSSPRSRNDMMRKSVKFNEAENKSTSINKQEKNQQQPVQEAEKSSTTPKIEMNLNWIMTLAYADQNVIKEVKSIENYDKTIKNIDVKLVEKLDENENPSSKKLTKAKSIDEDRERDAKSIPNEITGKKVEDENLIYVFECKQWLAKDQGDKKIERILKVTNILNAK